jgi:hypothetical protein
MLIFPCRVNANCYVNAQEAVVALMLDKGLTPTEVPKPKRAIVQYGPGVLWECYAKCEEVAPCVT